MDKNILSDLESKTDYFGIFRKIACIGDSLSSGELVAKNDNGNRIYCDYFEYSWGQFIARKYGLTAYNFSRGGMTAKEYLNNYADEKKFWSTEFAAQAYFIALGVNDLFGAKCQVGSIDDVYPENPEKNADTFAGNYCRIISRYKRIQPRAKFFLITMPDEETDDDFHKTSKIAHAKLLYDVAEKFDNTFVIDLHKYAPKHALAHWMNGHLTPAGYLLTAEQISALTNEIIKENFDEFRDVGFIGTDLHE